MSEPKSQALVPAQEKELQQDREVARRYINRLADSPFDIKRGEVALLDRHGVAHGRKWFDRKVWVYKAGIYGALVGGGLLAISGAWLPGAALYLVGLAPSLATKYRGTMKLAAVELLAREGNLDEAQRRLDALPELRRRNPLYYQYIAGNLASHRGEYGAAIARWREASARAKGFPREWLKQNIVRALMLSGQLAEAKLVWETVKMPPGAEPVLAGLTLTRTMFALHEPGAEVAVDELHEHAKLLLAYSHTGTELAAVGWLFERAGDDEMAQMLATEALERMHYPYLATWWPALQQWLDGRTKAPEL